MSTRTYQFGAVAELEEWYEKHHGVKPMPQPPKETTWKDYAAGIAFWFLVAAWSAWVFYALYFLAKKIL